jgi:hypothetical protein
VNVDRDRDRALERRLEALEAGLYADPEFVEDGDRPAWDPDDDEGLEDR